jgi:hypothetical protein
VMPELNGPDAAQHIVGRRPEMRVLYVWDSQAPSRSISALWASTRVSSTSLLRLSGW